MIITDDEIINYNHQKICYFPKNYFLKYSKLEELNLSNNKLKCLDYKLFKNIPELKMLNVSNNLLLSLNHRLFKNIPNLKILDLQNNRLSIIKNHTFAYIPKLSYLNLNNNKLKKIEKSALYNLKYLKYLSLLNNFYELQIHANNFNYIKNIEYLYLGALNFNKLECLHICHFSIFNNLQNLYSINISKTMITEIKKNTFYNLPNLNYLSICFNKHLKRIENNFLFNVYHLNLLFINYNPKMYSCFAELNYVKELKSLYLNNNNLQTISYDLCKNCNRLNELHLQNNNLDSFDMKIPASLQKLYLQNNILNDVKIKKNNLEILNVENNLLTRLYIYKNNIPFSIKIKNNLLLNYRYKDNYVFPYKEYILFLLRKYCNLLFHTCFEIYQNVDKFYLLEINLKEILYIIQICNYPIILNKYFYKLYLLGFLKKYIKNKNELKKYYFTSIKRLETLINIKYTHKLLYRKITDTFIRKNIFEYI